MALGAASQKLETLSLSVIVCCYTLRRWNELNAAVSAILAQTPDELIVVADHNPELKARLAEAFPGLAVIENRFEPGLSGARNAGVAASQGDLLMFIDDDAEIQPGAFDRIREAMGDQDVLGAVAKIEPAWAGPAPVWFPEAFLWVVGCTYEGLKPGPVRNVIGAAMCVRRSVFERVGGFVDGIGRAQSGLPLGCEETELCIRANAAFPGRTFVYEPRARCLHHVPLDRMTWRYFAIRCYAEGVSKAHISALRGARTALSAEWIYVKNTILFAALRECKGGVAAADVGRLGKALALVFGLAVTTFAYLVARVGLSVRRGRSASPAIDARALPDGAEVGR